MLRARERGKGKDGWNIESIMTFLHINGRYEIVTADFHVNRWVDEDRTGVEYDP